MEYVVQALEVLSNFVHAEMNTRCPKTEFYAIIRKGAYRDVFFKHIKLFETFSG